MSAPELLIVRAVSFQQLDGLLPGLRAAFPGHRLLLLTHPHGLGVAAKYAEVAEAIPYPHRGPFRLGRGVPGLKGRRLDAVVVPVASVGGGGFFNVFAFAFTLQARQRWVCTPAGELRPLTAGALAMLAGRNLGATLVAALGTALLVPLLLVGLPIYLWRLRGKGE